MGISRGRRDDDVRARDTYCVETCPGEDEALPLATGVALESLTD